MLQGKKRPYHYLEVQRSSSFKWIYNHSYTRKPTKHPKSPLLSMIHHEPFLAIINHY